MNLILFHKPVMHDNTPILKLISTITIILIALAIFLRIDVSAQPQLINWSEEELLAEINDAPPQSFYPVIAVGPFRDVHIFWVQNDSIMYMQKSNNSWSDPLDLIWSQGVRLNFVSTVIDEDGELYLTWAEYNQIFLKKVHVTEANKIKSWTEDRVIGEIGGIGTPLKIAVDSQGNLHIVFADWYGLPGKTSAGNVYHFFSKDKGETWSNFTQVSYLSGGDLATDPRMAFDKKGNAHIVWGQMHPNADEEQISIQYNQVDSSGNVAHPPIELMHREPDFRWIMSANIAAINESDLIVTWACGELAGRCFTWSKDDGQSWADAQKIFSGLIGLSGWDALTSNNDNLYWITDLRYPQAMYYAMWLGQGWVEQPYIASTDRVMKLGENVMAAIAQGNEIHVVVQLDNEISYMSGATSAQPIPITPTSGSIPSITESLTSPGERNHVDRQVISTPDNPTFPNTEPQITSVSNSRIITLSSLFVFILLIFVWIIVRLSHKL